MYRMTQKKKSTTMVTDTPLENTPDLPVAMELT